MFRKPLTQFLILAIFLLSVLVVPLGVRAGGVCGGDFVVEKGDTLESIAATCGTTVNAILSANPGIGTTLTPGQKLIVPGVGSISTPTFTATALPAVTATVTVTPPVTVIGMVCPA